MRGLRLEDRLSLEVSLPVLGNLLGVLFPPQDLHVEPVQILLHPFQIRFIESDLSEECIRFLFLAPVFLLQATHFFL